MIETQELTTDFAPPERASQRDLERQARYFSDQPLLRQLLDAMPNIVLILNQERQTVYANARVRELFEADSSRSIIGLRAGEVLGCAHALETPGGCGTTKFCRTCGAARAFLSSQDGMESTSVQECRIAREQDGGIEALDFRVWATPFEDSGECFTIFALVDISDEKRRRALERVFFHDLLNVAGMLRTALEMKPRADPDDAERLGEKISGISARLIGEIKAQRDLAAAENNELSVNQVPIQSLAFLRHIAEMYASHDAAEKRRLTIAEQAEDVVFSSDSTLLGRVIGNMVKNALEASQPGQTITLGTRAVGEEIEFWVHNPTWMPEDVQLQVFQRSFSTKGPGRGLGAYSMKLLSQRYLQGDVSFVSSEGGGTTFRARYPLQLPASE
jgi:PAS domain-containing protein